MPGSTLDDVFQFSHSCRNSSNTSGLTCAASFWHGQFRGFRPLCLRVCIVQVTLDVNTRHHRIKFLFPIASCAPGLWALVLRRRHLAGPLYQVLALAVAGKNVLCGCPPDTRLLLDPALYTCLSRYTARSPTDFYVGHCPEHLTHQALCQAPNRFLYHNFCSFHFLFIPSLSCHYTFLSDHERSRVFAL